MSTGALGALIEAFVRRAAGPPMPRALPYLGLESASGTSSQLLDTLSAHGIFRKYELVLDLAGDLGGTGRWLAGRLGCSAVVTAASPGVAASGRALTRRAALGGRVEHVVAAATALPFLDATFTHVWAVETLGRLSDWSGALAEAWRVVRPGGHLAVQDLAPVEGVAPPAVPGWWFAPPAQRREALARAGFADVVVRTIDEPQEQSARVAAARQQFGRELAARPGLAFQACQRDLLRAALDRGALRVVHLFGRRP